MSVELISQIKVLYINTNHADDKNTAIITELLKQLEFASLTLVSPPEDIKSSFERILKERTIDLVIISPAEETLTSDTIITAIRNNKKTFKLPIIVIADKMNPANIQKALAAGVTEYIIPPLTNKIMIERIANALRLPIRNNSQYVIEQKMPTNINKINTNEITLLVVDDITENIELVRGIVDSKYHLKAAKNANMAMKICLSNKPPDLILLDIMMPDVDGLTFCKQLKSNPLTKDIAVIFLTAMSDTQDMIKGLGLGAVDYLTKPINPDLFIARVDMHVKLILEQYKLKAKIQSLEKTKPITKSNGFSL